MKHLLVLALLTHPLFSQDASLSTAAVSSKSRAYNVQVTAAEMSEISFIINTLADKPYHKLIFYRSQVSAAGARVDHLHPLKFCLAIFSDERLKVGMRNIRKKHLVWKEFAAGVGDSFEREWHQQNIDREQIKDFASSLSIDPSKIFPLLESQKWEAFLELLVELIPREGPLDRYDF